jgi:hypothetical protein
MLSELSKEHEVLQSKFSCLLQKNSELLAKEHLFNEAISSRAEMNVKIDDLEIRMERKMVQNEKMRLQGEADEITKFNLEKEIKILNEKDKERQMYNNFLLKSNQDHVANLKAAEESLRHAEIAST